MRGRRSAHRHPSPAGFTLVEVLVAMFVVALGVAGAAAVQAVLVRAADEGARLADGLRLAEALAQRMRANPVAMALPDAANPYLDVELDAGAGATPVAPCYAAACGPMQMAGFDLGETAAQLAGRFPGGRLRVCRDAPAPDAAGLLPWDCTGGPDAPVAIKLGWRGRPGQPDAPAVFLAIGTAGP